MSRTANPVKTLYVKLGDNMTESIFAKYNAKIMSCISGIYIVKTSLENAERLAEEEGVERIETPLPLFPSNDVTRSAVNANAAQDNPLPPLTQAFTGKGVLAGIVDGGF